MNMSLIAKALSIQNDFNKLSNDLDRLKYLQKNNFLKVICDNDLACVQLSNLSNEKYDKLDTIRFNHFDLDFGNRDGILNLFKLLDIKAEFC